MSNTRAHTLEIQVRAGREAERFNTAVYRFLELAASSHMDAMGVIRTTPLGPFEQKVVTLWDEQAVDDLRSYLARRTL